MQWFPFFVVLGGLGVYRNYKGREHFFIKLTVYSTEFSPWKTKKQLFHVVKHCFGRRKLQIQSAERNCNALFLKHLFNLCVGSIPKQSGAN
jgi:hypothetical protein